MTNFVVLFEWVAVLTAFVLIFICWAASERASVVSVSDPGGQDSIHSSRRRRKPTEGHVE